MAGYTYRAQIAYDGAAFAGYARQPGRDTVEAAVREALEGCGRPIRALAVAGRTDRGVHATGQVISWRFPHPVPPARIRGALDAVRPGALAALDVRPVPRWFHASFAARARRYVYLWPDDPDLDAAAVDRLLLPLAGRRCFSAFARDTRPGASTVRTLRVARARRVAHGAAPVLRFDLSADGFLRRQARVMVATALAAARAGAPDHRLLELAAAGDRTRTAPPAPPGGLYLAGIVY